VPEKGINACMQGGVLEEEKVVRCAIEVHEARTRGWGIRCKSRNWICLEGLQVCCNASADSIREKRVDPSQKGDWS